MAKNLSNLLQKGNLTPKERYLLVIQNDVLKATTGKKTLTEADIEALQNWQAKTSNEAREWNKYNEGWKLSGRAGIDAEFIYADTKAEHYRKNILTTELANYPIYRERLNALKTLKKIKVVDIKEAIEITNKQREQKLKNGIDFDYAIYQLAFESLSDELRKDILILDQEVEYEPSYLNDEETIADLLNGKEKLSKEAKEKYAELVADRSYNEFAKEYQLHGAFASLPIMDIAKKWAKDKGIKPRPKDYEWLEKIKGGLKRKGLEKKFERDITDWQGMTIEEAGKKRDDEWLLEDNLNEILEDYARDNKTTIKKILKETLLKWLEDGLPYTPIVISEDKKTYGEDTKLPHNELFKEWLKAKDKARATLQKLIDNGELKADQTGQDRTITGDSLYAFKGDFEFIKEFKEQADRYDANAGLIYADNDKEHTGDNLDRELLIAEKDKDGKPSIVSLFGMSIKKIEAQFNQHFFTETEKDGETYLDFKSDNIKEVFKTTRQSLIDGYAKLLAFQEIHKKLSKIYEIDLTFLITPKVKQVSEFIDTHNLYLGNALEDTLGFGAGFGLYKKPLKTSENLYIEKEKIALDINIAEEYGKKFYEILGDEYNY